MNRLTSRIALACALFVSLAATANAAWVPLELRWLHQRSWNVGAPQDTLWITAAASKVDTTSGFYIDDADPAPIGTIGVATADSTEMGHLVVYADSTVGSTIDFRASSIKIQANYSLNNANWQTVYTFNGGNTSGQKAMIVPILVNKSQQSVGIDATARWALHGCQIRAIFTGGASVAGPMLRVRWVKYQNRMVTTSP